MSEAHICDDCVRRQGLKPKYPPDSGVQSLLCYKCRHFNIGSNERYIVGDWLSIKVARGESE